MHSFLGSIGFKNIINSEHDVDMLLDRVFKDYDQRKAVKTEDGKRAFLELSKNFGPNMGIRLCGELDEHGFHRQYYFPFLNSSTITTAEEVSVDPRTSGDSFTGICDDGRTGISLIFFLQNPADYYKDSLLLRLKENHMTTTLTGLSQSGAILLPVKREIPEEVETWQTYSGRSSLVAAAKNGSPEAIESLTISDMDIYAMVSRRIQNEDVLSIVDTCFMPHGMECDQYQIIGNILFYTKVKNDLTDEIVYQLSLECNDMLFDVCINADDLIGEPESGRRFKGNIWLQGKINHPE